MFSFRYNPVYERWVLVGTPVVEPEAITEAHLLDGGRHPLFVAATYPRHIFELDPLERKSGPIRQDVLHTERQAVGEYELLLYRGETDFWQFDTSHWMHWLALLQHRIRGFQKNTHLNHLAIRLPTSQLYSLSGYLRVGEVVATSHPVMGQVHQLDKDVAERLQHDSLFSIFQGDQGWVYAPSAPLHSQELWYIPFDGHPSLADLSLQRRRELAYVLSKLTSALHTEWPEQHYCVEIHTALTDHTQDSTWWVQLYQENSTSLSSTLPLQLAPEGFVHILHQLFGRLQPPTPRVSPRS